MVHPSESAMYMYMYMYSDIMNMSMMSLSIYMYNYVVVYVGIVYNVQGMGILDLRQLCCNVPHPNRKHRHPPHRKRHYYRLNNRKVEPKVTLAQSKLLSEYYNSCPQCNTCEIDRRYGDMPL